MLNQASGKFSNDVCEKHVHFYKELQQIIRYLVWTGFKLSQTHSALNEIWTIVIDVKWQCIMIKPILTPKGRYIEENVKVIL